MTPSRILEALAAEIRAGWAGAHRCRVSVAPDPARAMELLSAGAPEGSALALWYEGDSAADDRGLCSDEQLEGRFSLALCRHPGLSPRDSQGAPGALREAESLRRFLLREASGDGLLDGWRYSGAQAFQLAQGDAPLGGYTITLLGCYDAGGED